MNDIFSKINHIYFNISFGRLSQALEESKELYNSLPERTEYLSEHDLYLTKEERAVSLVHHFALTVADIPHVDEICELSKITSSPLLGQIVDKFKIRQSRIFEEIIGSPSRIYAATAVDKKKIKQNAKECSFHKFTGINYVQMAKFLLKQNQDKIGHFFLARGRSSRNRVLLAYPFFGESCSEALSAIDKAILGYKNNTHDKKNIGSKFPSLFNSMSRYQVIANIVNWMVRKDLAYETTSFPNVEFVEFSREEIRSIVERHFIFVQQKTEKRKIVQKSDGLSEVWQSS